MGRAADTRCFGPVTVLGNGKQRVAPIYLGDVVAAIEAAIISGLAGTFDPNWLDASNLSHIGEELPVRIARLTTVSFRPEVFPVLRQ